MIWITLLRSNWKLLSILAFLGAIIGWGLLMRAERDSAREKAADIQAEYDQFQAKVRVEGEAAKLRAAETIIKDESKKEKADAQNITAHAAVAVPVKRMRDQHSDSSFVPPATASSSRPDLACFDRAEYQRIDGEFTRMARQRADEGTAATIDLNTAKIWAHEP